jgi:diadenosine tetraphosphatase ApaH/serine/threonine PP2A family protein phosphatase
LYNLSAEGNLNALPAIDDFPHRIASQRRWVTVLGAVGQPRDGNPKACYGLLDDEAGTLTFTRVSYDVDTAARKIVAAGLPIVLAERIKKGL